MPFIQPLYLDTDSLRVGNNQLLLQGNAVFIGNTLTVGNQLWIGSNVNSGSQTNAIRFGGINGDGPGEYAMSFIMERYIPNTAEDTELLLFKGNDGNATSGTDRIRIAAPEFRVDITNTTSPGANIEFTANQAYTNRFIVAANGNIGLSNSTPTMALSVGNSTFGNAYFSGSITVSGNNITGGGIVLSDDGDIIDNNDGYATFRFTNGVQIYSNNKAGSVRHSLRMDGSYVVSNSTVVSFTVAANGNIGVGGNTTPADRLVVVGGILYTGTARAQIATLTDAATITWDTSSAQVVTVTLGGARTMAAPTNLLNGAFYAIEVLQDATGGRTLAWNSVFKWTGGAAPTLSTAANARDYFVFRSNGTNLYEQGRSLGVA